jgi:hypothetical protein
MYKQDKDMNNMRNKILSLLVLLVAATGAWAEELTVYDGTATNSYVPVYGFYADAYLKCQAVYPATELAAMAGNSITSLTYYATAPATEAWNSTFQVHVIEVADATISSYNDLSTATLVYEGTLDGTQSTMTIPFTTPYNYQGGNLLVSVSLTITGIYKSITWGGETVNGASVQGYSYSDFNAISATQRDFLPKTTFTYEASNVDVTTNVEEGDTCFTEAWFNMPAYDATVTYELVRDMEYKVNAYVGDDAEVTYRHRVEKVSDNLYKPVNITDDAQIIALFNVIDTIDAASPKPLVYGTDFTVTIVDEDQNETVPAEFNFAPGIYTVKVTGIGDYDGLIDSRNQFKLYYGYELKVAPRNYATYYKDEPLTTANENAELYTIASINGSKAVLSEQMQSVPKNTPFLIYNNHQTDTVTFVLSPVEGGQLSLIQYAPEFKGTLNDSIMPASSEGTKYYICNGYDFVWVRDAGTIAANRCWLEISNSNARALNIVFDDEATSIKNLTPTLSEGEGAWYDLNGRKLNGMPTRKGVYILNGKKTVIK